LCKNAAYYDIEVATKKGCLIRSFT